MRGNCARLSPDRRWPAGSLEPGESQIPSIASQTIFQSPRYAAMASRWSGVLLIAQTLCACTQDLECSGSDVQAALKQALDNLYAESRTVAQVDLSITDIVSAGPPGRRIACKAMIHLDVNSFGRKIVGDPVISYTAEATDSGRILVIATP